MILLGGWGWSRAPAPVGATPRAHGPEVALLIASLVLTAAPDVGVQCAALAGDLSHETALAHSV